MGRYFAGNYTGGAFELFSDSHLVTLILVVAINLLIYIYRDRIKEERVNKYFRYIIAVMLIVQELSYNIWNIYIGEWSVASTLPLHLCGASVILAAIMLFKKSYSIYEVVYFWGVGGATQALLTPDLGIYSFPHYAFIQFFVSHGLVVTACLFATFTLDFRPKLKSLWRAAAGLNIYMVIIAVVNILTGGNYLFICSKPASASLMDYLGPWPWYILSLEALAIVMFFLILAPFGLKEMRRKRESSKQHVSTM
jgi:hypothetical integral membrane protein (TIGR02206 family)